MQAYAFLRIYRLTRGMLSIYKKISILFIKNRQVPKSTKKRFSFPLFNFKASQRTTTYYFTEFSCRNNFNTTLNILSYFTSEHFVLMNIFMYFFRFLVQGSLTRDVSRDLEILSNLAFRSRKWNIIIHCTVVLNIIACKFSTSL